MIISKAIKEKILQDNDFSLECAKILGIQQTSVFLLVRRNSDRLSLYSLVQWYKKNGFKEAEIFEQESGKTNEPA